MGPRKTELLKLKKMLQELYDNNKAMCNSGEIGRFGMARDRQGKELKKAIDILQKAGVALASASQAFEKALEVDRKATTAYLNNKDKDSESWLEDELEAADKVTKAKRAIFVKAKDDLEEAEKQRLIEQKEMDKFDAQDDKNFEECNKRRAEIGAVEKRIAAVEKDLKDNPSLGRKLKDLLKS